MFSAALDSIDSYPLPPTPYPLPPTPYPLPPTPYPLTPCDSLLL